MPDYFLAPGEQHSAPPEIDDAAIYPATIGDTLVVIVLPRFRSVQMTGDGVLLTADAWTTRLRAHGARPLTSPDFPGGIDAGWSVTFTAAASSVAIDGPGDLAGLFSGTLDFDPAWQRDYTRVHQTGRGLVVVTGTAAELSPAGAQDMLAHDRALWIRAQTHLT